MCKSCFSGDTKSMVEVRRYVQCGKEARTGQGICLLGRGAL